MKPVELLRFSGPDDLARAVARDWLAEAQAAAQVNRPFCVALSGGRSARLFFSAAAELAASPPVDWNAVHFFWADERCVPPGDPESNYGLARQWLLQPLKIPERNIHCIRGEAPPAQAARDAGVELCRFASKDDAGMPALDLIFLGMGEDGHVASLFPGAAEGAVAEVYRAVIGAKPPPQRITLTYPVIVAARKVWVLVGRPGKEAALRASLDDRGATPLARVLGARLQTRVYTDEPVA